MEYIFIYLGVAYLVTAIYIMGNLNGYQLAEMGATTLKTRFTNMLLGFAWPFTFIWYWLAR